MEVIYVKQAERVGCGKGMGRKKKQDKQCDRNGARYHHGTLRKSICEDTNVDTMTRILFSAAKEGVARRRKRGRGHVPGLNGMAPSGN
jgi:hypothetical protein